MDKNQWAKANYLSANVNFAAGTLFLLNYTGVLPLDFVPRGLFLALTVSSYLCAGLDLLRYVRGGNNSNMRDDL
ncbi:MAG: hypothetical protein KBS74_02375 [Clostridiales bacterium]|nr:hypothetical protein [Candidatus Cacconaster stercorequi]